MSNTLASSPFRLRVNVTGLKYSEYFGYERASCALPQQAYHRQAGKAMRAVITMTSTYMYIFSTQKFAAFSRRKIHSQISQHECGLHNYYCHGRQTIYGFKFALCRSWCRSSPNELLFLDSVTNRLQSVSDIAEVDDSDNACSSRGSGFWPLETLIHCIRINSVKGEHDISSTYREPFNSLEWE